MLVEFCISSLVIICLVKSFYELEERFLWQVTDNFWSTLPIAPPASSHRGFSMGLDLGPGAVAPSPRAAAVGNRLRQDLVSDQSRMPPEYAATNSHSIMHT